MTAITFDTLKFVERLKAAGVPEAQAKAQAESLADVMGTAELATKADLREMETRVMAEMKLLRWMMGATFGGVLFILLRLLIPTTH